MSSAAHISYPAESMVFLIGIVKSWPIIRQAVGLAGREFKGGEKKEKEVRIWRLCIINTEDIF